MFIEHCIWLTFILCISMVLSKKIKKNIQPYYWWLNWIILSGSKLYSTNVHYHNGLSIQHFQKKINYHLETFDNRKQFVKMEEINEFFIKFISVLVHIIMLSTYPWLVYIYFLMFLCYIIFKSTENRQFDKLKKQTFAMYEIFFMLHLLETFLVFFCVVFCLVWILNYTSQGHNQKRLFDDTWSTRFLDCIFLL